MSYGYEDKVKCPVCKTEVKRQDLQDYYKYRLDEFGKSGSHPLIQEYNKVREEAVAKLKELNKQIEAEHKKEPQPHAKYGNIKASVKMTSKDPFNRSDEQVEAVTLTVELLNKDEKDAYMNRWGGIMGSWDETRHTASYYRTPQGILTEMHGGWIGLIKTPSIITTEEWERIKKGDIPVSLKNEGWLG